ncbi:MAG: chromosome segregation protein SMC [Hyphomicrobiales bacterium]|nr:chromosome segregation protein SMC [Hyphomicrobiales bacterium]
MLRFDRLRLSGFKSFVDSTELLIDKGLTGVVGPNGCGKSNLVEALRWVMGETSAKQMRGTEMDDVIFGGTASRPSRNIAEVTLHLDNRERSAPAVFNDFDELEISRKIEREKGSLYRVNGKDVRARDVQLLFADSATGARSTAIVSQGRIGAVIAAKPKDRRMLLEEAAGITGLHSRRHEAELRLRAAESNMERLDDVLITLEAQLAALKKQARQASRYRNLSEHIRKAEATYFHLRWELARGQAEVHQETLRAAEAQVIELTALVAAVSTRHAEGAALLPSLRQHEAEAAARLQRLVLARERLDEDERRLEAAQQDGRNRLNQAAVDIERETALAADAAAAMARLQDEDAAIARDREGEDARQAEAGAGLAAAQADVDALEGRVAELSDAAAAEEARRASLNRAGGELEQRHGRLAARAAEVAAQLEALAAEGVDPDELARAGQAQEDTRVALEAARADAAAAETARDHADEAVAAALAAHQEADGARARLEAEEQALAGILASAAAGGEGEGGEWPALIDSVTVEPGFEAALGAALGEDLSAPVDQPAPLRWRTLGAFAAPPPLPEGARPLDQVVRAPKALQRRLSQVGVVEDAAAGDRLADHLFQGQRLVSRDGGLWRWDGFTAAAGSDTAAAAAARLEQRNRLAETRGRLGAVRAAAEDAAAGLESARQAAAGAAGRPRGARRGAGRRHRPGRARDALAELQHRATAQAARLQSLTESRDAVVSDLAETAGRLDETRQALAAMPDPQVARDRIAAEREELARLRAILVERQSTHANLLRQAGERARRQQAIAQELDSWRQRNAGADRRAAELRARRAEIEAELERLAARPAEIAEQRRALMEQLEESEAARRQAGDRLAEAENGVGEAESALRTAEADMAKARENMVRLEGHVEQDRQAAAALTERIAERLDCRPEDTREIAGLGDDEDLPDMADVERKLERLQRERENMGPVNLRAEQEAAEQREQIDTLELERNDLLQAIEKLRRGIAELNREGRQRLLESYHQVDKHFQGLFVRLFGGGRAHLTLIESDDPLEAGLEIMASPPGKRLQVLSLLSGGEQALTALSLLFAVFLTNPAPICVLDEVDAPLDDANVDRVCTLLDEMAASGRTRFVVITHHRMTMARMDRLFGVTMAERGVSQLVSVDLQRAAQMREAV